MTTLTNTTGSKKVNVVYNSNMEKFIVSFIQCFYNGIEKDEQLLEMKWFATEKAALNYAKKILA